MPTRSTTPDLASAAAQRAAGPLEAVEAGHMWIDRQYAGQLRQAGLASFEAVMATTAGRLLRALSDRENWRLEFHDAQREPRVAYLKKHHVRGWRAWLRARLRAGPGDTPGRVEARNVARLEQAGIAAMRLMAYGEKLHASGLVESFILTEGLAGHTQLDHFLRRRFEAFTGRPGRRNRDLDRLIGAVAGVAGRFHRLGFNHRDLYCCHFFIREAAGGEFEVNLIDLQRVEHRRWFRGRWLVKDLAQLAYSAPRDRISCTHKMAFIKEYLGVRKLRPADKRLIRQVLAKKEAMERHLGAHP